MPMVIEVGKADKEEKGEFDKYEVENALRTLMEAEEIRGDSALMAEVQDLAGKKKKTISSIADIRAARNDLLAEKDAAPKKAAKMPKMSAKEHAEMMD